jgi:hypothetical protein
MAGRKHTDIVPLTLRLREDLRRRLESDAKRRNDSINNAVIERLEASFAEDTQFGLVEALTGGGDSAQLLKLIARALLMQSIAGGNWKGAPESAQAVKDAIGFIVDAVAGLPFREAEVTPEVTTREKLIALLKGDQSGGRLLASIVLNDAGIPAPVDPAMMAELHKMR